jgi:hypothetical protein
MHYGIGDRVVVVLPYGGVSAGLLIEDLTNEFSEMDAPLGGAICIVVLYLACRLGDARFFFGQVVGGTSRECKQVSRSKLARITVICPIYIREACKLEVVVRVPPNVMRMLTVPLR